MFFRINIREHQRGLFFRDGVFKKVLKPGVHWVLESFWNVRVDVVSVFDYQILHKDLEQIVRTDGLDDEMVVYDLKDGQRGLIWIDGRFSGIVGPDVYAFWQVFDNVRVELVDLDSPRFEREQLDVIMSHKESFDYLTLKWVGVNQVGVLFVDGRYVETLPAGRYAFWENAGDYHLQTVGLTNRELEINGQEIITADKVTLRINAVIVWRVTDACKLIDSGLTETSLYREAQLALRAIIGTRELDPLLAEKDIVVDELRAHMADFGGDHGCEIISAGIKDIILPGEMKQLLNKVTEARKQAEANLIQRREETAAMRSQANTARMLENNPTLMRLRELEILEKIVTATDLKVVLGEKGLSERIMQIL